MDECVVFYGWLSVEMNVDESRGAVQWRKLNVLINVDEWNEVSAKWNVYVCGNVQVQVCMAEWC